MQHAKMSVTGEEALWLLCNEAWRSNGRKEMKEEQAEQMEKMSE